MSQPNFKFDCRLAFPGLDSKVAASHFFERIPLDWDTTQARAVDSFSSLIANGSIRAHRKCTEPMNFDGYGAKSETGLREKIEIAEMFANGDVGS